MKNAFFVKPIACMVVALLFVGAARSQGGTQGIDAGKLIENKSFVFVAQAAMPQRGGLRQLTSRYDLVVSGDSLVSNLPYFGRAYTAPMDPSDAGFNFTETGFQYSVKKNKRKGWEIEIKPAGNRDVRQMLLSVFENGSASLRVNSNNRQPISFNGFIQPRG